MGTKDYTVPVYRKIAKGELVKSLDQLDPFDCDFYLNVENIDNNFKLNTENMLRTTIYNINDRDPFKFIVTSNTTNIKITYKYLEVAIPNSLEKKKIPLYDVIRDIPYSVDEEFFSYFENEITQEYIVEVKPNGNLDIFFNKKSEHEQKLYPMNLVSSPLFFIDRTNNRIKIKKVKDRLVITIDLYNLENGAIDTKSKDFKMHIDLGSEYLFEPKYHNSNWIEFYECIFKDLDQNIIYMYNHSFNIIDKKEVVQQDSFGFPLVKDPYKPNTNFDWNILVDDLYQISYPSWRSNLLLNTKYDCDLYIYISMRYNAGDVTKNIYVSSTTLNNNDYILVLSRKKSEVLDKTRRYELVTNDYSLNEIRDSNSELYTLVSSRLTDEKYNRYNDVRFGNNKLEIDPIELIRDQEVYVQKNNGLVILQEKDMSYYTLDNMDTSVDHNIDNHIQNFDYMNQLKSDINSVYSERPINNLLDKIKVYEIW